MNFGAVKLWHAGAALVTLSGMLAAAMVFEDPALASLLIVAAMTAVYAVAVSIAWRRGGGLWTVLVVAALCRLPLALAPPLLEDDIYRYVWDGRVLAAGRNPYRHSPQEVLDALRSGDATEDLSHLVRLASDPAVSDAFLRINYPSVPTIYPPATEAVFALAALLAPGSPTAVKLVLLLFDLGTVLIIVRRLGVRAIIYAWCPLVLKELAASGHSDSVSIFFAVLGFDLATRGRSMRAGLALGVGVLARLWPVALVAVLWRRLGARGLAVMAATIALGVAPFVGAGPRLVEGLGTYAANWEVDDALFSTLAALTGGRAGGRVAQLLILGALALALARRSGRSLTGDAAGSATLAAAMVLSGPVVDPWYLTWLFPFLAWLDRPPWAAVALAGSAELYLLHFSPLGAPDGLGWAIVAAPVLVALATWLKAWRERRALRNHRLLARCPRP